MNKQEVSRDNAQSWLRRVPLVAQIAVGLVLGVILALAWPEGAQSVSLLGKVFVAALKAVAPRK